MSENEKKEEEGYEIKINNCYPKVFIYLYINETNFTNKSFGELDLKKTKSGFLFYQYYLF